MKNFSSRKINLFFLLLKHGFMKEFFKENSMKKKHSDIFESEINIHDEK